MTVNLTNKFLSTTRGLILQDGGGFAWTIDPLTNKITLAGSGSGVSSVVGTANQIAVATGGGTVTLSFAAGAFNSLSPMTTKGDMVYEASAGVAAQLPIGSTGQVMTVAAGIPAWVAIPTLNQNTSGTAAGLSATLVTGSGGTGVTGASLGAANGVVLGDSGTFTPTATGATTAGTTTYTGQNGFYSRIGNRCFFNLAISWSGATGTGQLVIGALPFLSNAAANNYSAVSMRYAGADTAQSYDGYIPPGASSVYIEGHIGGVGLAPVAIAASGNMIMSGSYTL